MPKGESNVTHTFPLINKRFHSLCSSSKSDYLWKIGIERLIRNNDEIWGHHLSRRMRRVVRKKEPKIRINSTSTITTCTEDEIPICYRQLYLDTFLTDVNIQAPFMYDNIDQHIQEPGIQIGVEFDIYITSMHHQMFLSDLVKHFRARTMNRVRRNGSASIIPRQILHNNESSSTSSTSGSGSCGTSSSSKS